MSFWIVIDSMYSIAFMTSIRLEKIKVSEFLNFWNLLIFLKIFCIFLIFLYFLNFLNSLYLNDIYIYINK